MNLINNSTTTHIENRPHEKYNSLIQNSNIEENNHFKAFNPKKRHYPRDKSVHQLFSEQAAQSQSAIAVRSETSVLTYKELDTKANQLANYLNSNGMVGCNTGILMDRSVDFIISVLAVLKTGGTYVPLNPDFPVERLKYLIEDSDVKVILSHDRFKDRLPINGPATLFLNKKKEEIQSENDSDPSFDVVSTDLAYIIYTSGTTGKPKGVCVNHRAIVRLVKNTNYMSIDKSHIFSQMSSISFDVSSFEIWGALLNGAQLAIPPNKNLSLKQISDFIKEIQVSVIALTTSLFNQIVDEHLKDLTSLRYFFTGGDIASKYHIEKAAKNLKRCSVINLYGPTENATNTTYYPIDPKHPIKSCVPIGWPISNTSVYILDNQLKKVPSGVTGEIHIGGDGLASGYYNKPELTQEKFIPDPFSRSPQDRLYKTGDLARYRPDGAIEFIGRVDHQVKIRGFRIELGEIENILGQHPKVKQICVTVLFDQKGDKHLAAYISTNGKIERNQIRYWLRKRLPHYMIPNHIVILKTLPLTLNGKVDQKKLPSMESILNGDTESKLNTEINSVVFTQTEQKVITIWQKVLGKKKLNLKDDFFDLGGHSLLMTQIITQLNTIFSIDFPLNAFFENPTISGIAQYIDHTLKSNPSKITKLKRPLNVQKEMRLEPFIKPANIIKSTIRLEKIFLTGATGFVGAFLLNQLLEHTSGYVYCLIRTDHHTDGLIRIQQSLTKYSLWDESYRRRIIPLSGDLSKPNLGLRKGQMEYLINEIDIIYHNGAWVNYLYPYSVLKKVNVESTKEILKIACNGKVKPVNYISTLSVFNSLKYRNKKELLESDPLIHPPEDTDDGYAISKWVAEKLVMSAMERGVPCAIYRLARVTGHSISGISNTNDMFCRLLKGIIQLGVAPKFNEDHIVREDNITPVDFVASSILHISKQPTSYGNRFHLVQKKALPLDDLIDWLCSLGYQINKVSLNDWQQTLKTRLKDDPSNALYAFWPIFNMKSQFSERSVKFDGKNCWEALKHSDIDYQMADISLMDTYLKYFLKSHYFPKVGISSDNKIDHKNEISHLTTFYRWQ